jgi:hypothetical protein
MGGIGPIIGSQAVGLGIFLAYLALRKRSSTKGKHKLHSFMLLLGGWGLASLTGAVIIGGIRLVKIFTDWGAGLLTSWLWNFLDFIPALIQLIPVALPYMLVIAWPIILAVEMLPAKWLPSKIRSHFSGNEDHHTPKIALFFFGVIAQVPAFAAAFGLAGLLQAVNG